MLENILSELAKTPLGQRTQTKTPIDFESGITGAITRNALRTLPAAISTVGIPGSIIELLGGKSPIPTVHGIKEKVYPLFEPKPGFLKPRNKIEEIIEMIQQDAPFALVAGALGGPAAAGAALGRSVLGSGAMKGAESLGAGPVGQLLAGVGGSLSLDLWKNLRPAKFKEGLESIRKFLYGKHREATKGVKHGAQKLEKAIQEDIKKTYTGQRKSPEKIQARQILTDIDKDIQMGKMDIHDALEHKVDLNRKLRDPHLSPNVKPYVERAVGTINEFIQDYGKIDPQSLKYFNEAENITKLLKSAEKAKDVVQDVVRSPRISSNIVKDFLKDTLKTGVEIAKAKPIREAGTKIYKMFRDIPSSRKILMDGLKAAAEGHKTAALTYFTKLDKIANKFDQQPTKLEWKRRMPAKEQEVVTKPKLEWKRR